VNKRDRMVDRREYLAHRKADQQALRLQAREYKRRLKVLNGESGRIAEIAKKSVTAEKFEDYQASQATALGLALEAKDVTLARLTERIAALENWKAKATGVGAVLVLISGFIGAAIMRAIGG